MGPLGKPFLSFSLRPPGPSPWASGVQGLAGQFQKECFLGAPYYDFGEVWEFEFIWVLGFRVVVVGCYRGLRFIGFWV